MSLPMSYLWSWRIRHCLYAQLFNFSYGVVMWRPVRMSSNLSKQQVERNWTRSIFGDKSNDPGTSMQSNTVATSCLLLRFTVSIC